MQEGHLACQETSLAWSNPRKEDLLLANWVCMNWTDVSRQMSVNGLDKAGSTPLHWASHGGHTECVQRMLAVPNCEINVQVVTFDIFRPHRSTTYVDAVYCYRPNSVVCRPVTLVSPTKTAAPIEMPFGLRTWVGPRNHVLNGGSRSPMGWGNFEGERGVPL